MIFSLSGTHCNGKTSIFNELRDMTSEDSKHVVFVEGPTREAKKQGLPINNNLDNYDTTQLYCLSHDLNVLLNHKKNPLKIFITERSLLDTYVYTKYLFEKGKVSEYVYRIVEASFLLHRNEFTGFLIPTHHDLKFENDGTRVEDVQFREDISKLFVENYHTPQYYFISGTMYERLGLTLTILKRATKTKDTIFFEVLDRKALENKYTNRIK